MHTSYVHAYELRVNVHAYVLTLTLDMYVCMYRHGGGGVCTHVSVEHSTVSN